MIYVLGDPHFGARRNSTLFHQILMNELDLILYKITKKDSVVILGDVFDSRSSSDFRILNDCMDFFIRLSRKCKEVFILVGNHDLFYKETSTENVNCRFLGFEPGSDSKISPVKIIDSLRVEKIQGKKCLFIPWIDSEERKDEAEDKLEEGNYDVAFGHFDIFNLYGKNAPTNLTALNENKFPEDKIILSGHYHRRTKKERMTYVGSLIGTTFNDVGDTKGIHIIKGKKVEFIEGTSPKFEYIKVENPTGFLAMLEKATEKQLNSLRGRIKGNIIKLVVNEYSTDNDEIYKKVKEMAPLLLTVTYNRFTIDSDAEGEGFEGFDVKSDICDIISQYIDQVETKLPSDISSSDIKELIAKKHLEFKNVV